jgi:hypothetical protein
MWQNKISAKISTMKKWRRRNMKIINGISDIWLSAWRKPQYQRNGVEIAEIKWHQWRNISMV